MKELDGKELMHPFWMMPRMTDKELRTRNEEANAKGTPVATFNLEMNRLLFGVVTTGSLMSRKTNITRSVNVPIITNNRPIKQNEELIIQISPPVRKEKEPTKETWKANAKRSAAAAAGGAPKKPKGSSSSSAINGQDDDGIVKLKV